MSEPFEPPPELSGDLRALLNIERGGVIPPPAAQSRVWTHLAAALPTLPLGPPPLTAGHGLKAALMSKAALAVAAFGLGVGAGVGAAIQLRQRQPPVVAAPDVFAQPAPAPRLAPVLAPAPTPVLKQSATHALAKPAEPSRSVSADRDLADERRLLDRARSALTHGDASDALAALELDLRAHPRGALGEERDALTIQALAKAGRSAEARQAQKQFHKLYPESLLGPAVDAALEQAP